MTFRYLTIAAILDLAILFFLIFGESFFFRTNNFSTTQIEKFNTFLIRITTAFFASYVFYVLVVYLKEYRQKKKLEPEILKSVCSINSNLIAIFNKIDEEIINSKNKGTSERNELFRNGVEALSEKQLFTFVTNINSYNNEVQIQLNWLIAISFFLDDTLFSTLVKISSNGFLRKIEFIHENYDFEATRGTILNMSERENDEKQSSTESLIDNVIRLGVLSIKMSK